ncbi:DUF2189 domain-containing protein [Epibacterium sp. Ofav1-8]|uniref:DUF2189 domain-containing protein n=1 Tax=Epibacterium sp. Ofav1-8 TaxID=2917735 RepID=UPI001EF6B531|nr:DUF2189 domain-containing protein [Epibacterium sp. Ofav1-8]MCG7624033.1 DUF2189 domain-containing protein [Epibacterium sp. Ofav1-8]
MSETAPKTIGNPASWVLQSLRSASHGTTEAIEELRSDTNARPRVRTMDIDDISHALRAGWADFKSARSDAMFLVFIYPLIGLALVMSGFHLDVLPLLVPMVMGFAIVGPAAAIGLYEMSRRREAGESAGWMSAFSVLRSPAFASVLALAFYLAALFVIWIMVAEAIFGATLGPDTPASLTTFARDVFTTSSGWTMIVVGTLVGAAFAYAALAVSIVSFPLLLDRHVGLPMAVATSLQVMRQNRLVCLLWGALVGALLVLGSVPLFAGLIFVVPLLGHATWHFYRRAVM